MFTVYVVQSDKYKERSGASNRVGYTQDLTKAIETLDKKNFYQFGNCGPHTLVASITNILKEQHAKQITEILSDTLKIFNLPEGNILSELKLSKPADIQQPNYVKNKIYRLIQIAKFEKGWNELWKQEEAVHLHIAAFVKVPETWLDVERLPKNVELVIDTHLPRIIRPFDVKEDQKEDLKESKLGGGDQSMMEGNQTLVVMRTKQGKESSVFVCKPEEEETKVRDYDATVADNRRERVPYVLVASLRNVHHQLIERIEMCLKEDPSSILELQWIKPAQYDEWGCVRQKLYRLLRILGMSEWSNSRFMAGPFHLFIASHVDIPDDWTENLRKHVEVHRMNVILPKECKKLPKLRGEKRKNRGRGERVSKRRKVE
jgi:hypothetical protein